MTNRALKIMKDYKTDFARNLDILRKRAGLSLSQVAERSGYHISYLDQLRSGKKRNNIDTLTKFANVLGCTKEDLISTAGLRLVKLEGYVGAGAEIFEIEATSNFAIDEVEAPQGIAPDTVAAVIVKGDSMFPAYRDGDVIYYTKSCDYDPAVLRKECVVKVKDGATFIKILKPGSTNPRRFTLSSYNSPDIEDVQIEWACKVLWVKKAQ